MEINFCFAASWKWHAYVEAFNLPATSRNLFRLFARRRKNVDEIFCPVRLDTERGRICLFAVQNHIACFSMTWYQLINFLLLLFYIIIYSHAVSFWELMSNIQNLMHVVSLTFFNFIFLFWWIFFLTWFKIIGQCKCTHIIDYLMTVWY